MSLVVTHAYVSPVADGADASKMRPSDWGSVSGGAKVTHVLTGVLPAGQVDLSGVVAVTRQVNGHALSADVTVSKADVGLANVENTALSTWGGSGNLTTVGLLAITNANLAGSIAASKLVGTDIATVGTLTAGATGTGFTIALSASTVTGTLADGRLSANVPLINAANTFTALNTFSGGVSFAGVLATSVNALGTVSTDGLVLTNDTLSTAGVPVQMSPRLRIRGHVWNTTATAADNTSDFWWEQLPTSGATPTSLFKLGYSLNGAAATYPFTISNVGIATFTSTVTVGTLFAGSAAAIGWGARGFLATAADGHIYFTNSTASFGSRLKVDALPTVASGFGVGPAVTAGSTPFAGSVNVGTGGSATSGVINFNGTAFGTAPFVICLNTTTGAVLKASASTTQLTITGNAAFTANDVIAWICVSAK
jgi:hypothetical protein